MPICIICDKKVSDIFIYQDPRSEICIECHNAMQETRQAKPLGWKDLFYVFFLSLIAVAVLASLMPGDMLW